MNKGFEEMILLNKHIANKQMKKIFNIISHFRNANQNHSYHFTSTRMTKIF